MTRDTTESLSVWHVLRYIGEREASVSSSRYCGQRAREEKQYWPSSTAQRILHAPTRVLPLPPNDEQNISRELFVEVARPPLPWDPTGCWRLSIALTVCRLRKRTETPCINYRATINICV
ncbi:hypothetical protein K491DRAFT_241968 [Lophiostoma macrostomum CBS 122681]|uniref:Uncharacterized protein n=1 Tax=Lophiostoma macrostomum CBS 122681 TaxID=1314788 RepID=A0A6A6SLD3_9PLEO|nr:hypothetical protein K491DRAFT_241968 [Lophiostoma macrostomum CBS 122681]